MALQTGDIVWYKGGGKVARLEGTSGKWNKATVTRINKNKTIVSVMPDHRTKKGCDFFEMGAAVDMDKISLVDPTA